MTEYDNTNRFSLFKNANPVSDSSPTHTGKLNIDGKEYYLNAWLRDGKSGNKFYSGTVKPVVEKGSQTVSSGKRPALVDEEIPF